jgi:hypothetical protein
VYRYRGTCAGCGTPREFTFAAPARPAPRRTSALDGAVYFGGPEPSRLLDPAEWMLVAEVFAQAATVPDDAPDRSRAYQEARESLAVAVAAMNEVLKFVPASANTVPESAF